MSGGHCYKQGAPLRSAGNLSTMEAFRLGSREGIKRLCVSTFVLLGSFRELWLQPHFMISGLIRNLEWTDANDLYFRARTKSLSDIQSYSGSHWEKGK